MTAAATRQILGLDDAIAGQPIDEIVGSQKTGDEVTDRAMDATGLYLLARLRGHIVDDGDAELFSSQSNAAKNDARGIVLESAGNIEPFQNLKAAVTPAEMNAKPTDLEVSAGISDPASRATIRLGFDCSLITHAVRGSDIPQTHEDYLVALRYVTNRWSIWLTSGFLPVRSFHDLSGVQLVYLTELILADWHDSPDRKMISHLARVSQELGVSMKTAYSDGLARNMVRTLQHAKDTGDTDSILACTKASGLRSGTVMALATALHDIRTRYRHGQRAPSQVEPSVEDAFAFIARTSVRRGSAPIERYEAERLPNGEANTGVLEQYLDDHIHYAIIGVLLEVRDDPIPSHLLDRSMSAILNAVSSDMRQQFDIADLLALDSAEIYRRARREVRTALALFFADTELKFS
ncbi:hypothetical protein [Erythrobacter aureus]|uniref:Uncharacterized protein n=1 Tax=Erythrobacter aureus TaxID=2182384 RepID=A0A345YJC6_9SPHN|nr:hypothetical protein [Erythrobacter aureus]AXK44028.1 hypothetical protein DVR09_16375 [Erythrobacter aureus]